jgi:hypothetical protein
MKGFQPNVAARVEAGRIFMRQKFVLLSEIQGSITDVEIATLQSRPHTHFIGERTNLEANCHQIMKNRNSSYVNDITNNH